MRQALDATGRLMSREWREIELPVISHIDADHIAGAMPMVRAETPSFTPKRLLAQEDGIEVRFSPGGTFRTGDPVALSRRRTPPGVPSLPASGRSSTEEDRTKHRTDPDGNQDADDVERRPGTEHVAAANGRIGEDDRVGRGRDRQHEPDGR